MRHQRFTAPILIAGLLGLGLGAPAWADDSGNSGSTSDEAAAGDEPVSDEQLEQFVAAMGEIREIRMEYAPRMQEAENEEEQNEVRKEGREEMINAIEEQGLDPEEYNRIGQRINSDEELESRVRNLMQEQESG